MQKNDRIFIGHMLESIECIEQYAHGLEEAAFRDNRQIQDAIVRRFEIIGEAANNISEETREKFFYIAWSDIIGMRNNLIHEYFGIDLETVWDSVKNDLPELKEQIVRMLKE